MNSILLLLFIVYAIYSQPFKSDSLLSFGTLSCGRMDLLAKSWTSFFRYNTYPLKQLIVIDDCYTTPQKILALLPEQMLQYKDFIKIVINEKKMGIVWNVNQGMKLAKGKYLLWSEDDWFYNLRPNYIQDSIQLLQESDMFGLNISQVAIGRTRFFRNQMKFSPGGIGYFEWGRLIGFNPFIINLEDVLIDVFKGDLIELIMKQCPQGCQQLPCVTCNSEKNYANLIRKYKPEILSVLIDSDIKQRQTQHLGGQRHIIQDQYSTSYIVRDGQDIDIQQISIYQMPPKGLLDPVYSFQRKNKLYGISQNSFEKRTIQKYQLASINRKMHTIIIIAVIQAIILTIILAIIVIFIKKSKIKKYRQLPNNSEEQQVQLDKLF